MRIVSLASGSKGNATLVEEGESALLIDCGLSGREFAKRCFAAKIDPAKIIAAVFTHNHTDHTGGIDAFHKNFPDATLFANFMTAEAIAGEMKVDENDFLTFENGQTFEVGPFTITPFSIPHDTPDPVGFLISSKPSELSKFPKPLTYFHATDVGTPLDSIGVRLAEADVATLESNHDPVMLKTSGRPPNIIQRIYGARGHLSNDQSAEFVKKFASPKLKTLALGHLSSACNTPHFAEATMRTALDEIGRKDITLKILKQDEIVEI